MTVSSLVVCAWYFVFISHFKDQFVAKDLNREDSPLLDPRSSPTLELEVSNMHALSYDAEEETFPSTIKSSGDPGDMKRASPLKGGRKKVNTASESKGGFVPYNEVPVKKFSVQMSEESSIVKAEHMDLIASWLPGTSHRTNQIALHTPHNASLSGLLCNKSQFDCSIDTTMYFLTILFQISF